MELFPITQHGVQNVLYEPPPHLPSLTSRSLQNSGQWTIYASSQRQRRYRVFKFRNEVVQRVKSVQHRRKYTWLVVPAVFHLHVQYHELSKNVTVKLMRGLEEIFWEQKMN